MLGSGAEAYRTQICSRELVCHLLLMARIIVVPGGAILLCLDQHDPDACPRVSDGDASNGKPEDHRS